MQIWDMTKMENTNGRSFVIPIGHENFHLETPSRDGETIKMLGGEWLPNPVWIGNLMRQLDHFVYLDSLKCLQRVQLP